MSNQNNYPENKKNCPENKKTQEPQNKKNNNPQNKKNTPETRLTAQAKREEGTAFLSFCISAAYFVPKIRSPASPRPGTI